MTDEFTRATLEKLAEEAVFFTSDSRLTDKNTIFVALKGEHSDGHQFVHDALAKGVVACVVEQSLPIEDPRIVKCESTATAHRTLAKIFRRKFKGKVIAIGGSNGKTSTKDFLYTIVSEHFSAIKTLHSQNGYQGIPATLERLRPGLDLAVVEVGIDGPGDMQEHLRIVDPDLAILTSIGAEHLRQLGDLEGVYNEESKLVKHCSSAGRDSFIPEGDPFLDRLSALPSVTTCPRDPVSLDPRFKIEQLSGVARTNASLAISCALKLGMTNDQILQRLPHLKIPVGRGDIVKLSNQEYILEDFYNANLSSMLASIKLAQEKSKLHALPLVLILGDMLDLGGESLATHSSLLASLEHVDFRDLILVGSEFAKAQSIAKLPKVRLFDTSQKLAENILTLLPKPYFVLFKGSRGMKLEIPLTVLKNSSN